MSELKPAYLFCGDDTGKLDAARWRLRERAKAESGAAGLEVFEGDACRPAAVAQALLMPALAVGRRFLLADGVEQWRAGELESVEVALKALPPDTVVVMVARKKKPLARLIKAVERAGGEVRHYEAPKPWDMPRWVVQRAGQVGLEIDQATAQALVTRVGPSQLRLEHELEKLSLFATGGGVSEKDLLDAASHESSARVYELGDALVAGDRARTVALAEDLRQQGEKESATIFALVRHVRTVLATLESLDSGRSPGDIQRDLRLPPYVAKRVIKQAKDADRLALRNMLCRLADLDEAIKGGSTLSADTLLSVTLAEASQGR